jgi:predicted nucleic acid-binding protein
LDDLKARKIAKNLGLNITGTLGILTKAKQLGLINDLEKQIDDLQRKGIWISESVINEIRRIDKQES